MAVRHCLRVRARRAFGLACIASVLLIPARVAAARHGYANQITAANIIISQVVMLTAAVFASRIIRRWGFWRVILATIFTLPLRGVFATWLASPWGILPVQVFDGLDSGLQSAAIPAWVVHLLHGSGRANPGQGAVLAVQTAGGCLSPLLGGWLANRFGYPAAFLGLGSLAVVALAIWITQGAIIRHSCDTRRDELERFADVDTSALFH
ncbi:MFS transporter [Paraburkholderia heleia]|uniref:MFS transporter n=1 Tax=Paraburkholderia heleia TaxID=634127 RepID=UPI002AB6F0BE|nr:MFS transporter [Paraburkholderia heleia]